MITTPEQMREAAMDAVEDYCSDMPDLAGHGHSVGLKDAIRAIRAIPQPASTLESVYDNMADIPGLPEAYQPKNISAALRVLHQTPQPVAVTVKPLVWHDCADGTAHDDECQYEIEQDGGYWRVIRGVTGGTSYLSHASSIELAKAAAQADYEARILSALTIQPSDPLSDPRVVALVEAAKRALNNLENTESEFGITLESADSLRSSICAIGGEA